MKIIMTDMFIGLRGKEQNEKNHSHYALQIIIPFGHLRYEGKKTSLPIIICSYRDHFIRSDKEVVSILIDVHSKWGRILNKKYFNNDGIGEIVTPSINQVIQYLKCEWKQLDRVKNQITNLLDILISECDIDYSIDKRIDESIRYIKKDRTKKIGISELADNVYLSKTRFIHLFKDEVGTSTMKYITWNKLILSFSMLLKSEKTITEVAYEYGFSDSAHFSRIFKRHFGVSPKKLLIECKK